MKPLFAILTFTLAAFSQTIRYSEQPGGLVQTPKDMAAWEGLVCAGTSPLIISPMAVIHEAASKISVADPTLAAAQQSTAPKRSFMYRALTGSEDALTVGAATVPALQAAKLLKGSPWISGGIALAPIMMHLITSKQATIAATAPLPGTWVSPTSPNVSLAPGSCTGLLFFGEFSSTLTTFEVTLAPGSEK